MNSNELATLDAQIIDAEARLTTTEKGLATAARAGYVDLEAPAAAVEQAEQHLKTLQARRDRAVVLSRLKDQEDRKAADAREAHAVAVKANAAAVKRETAQLRESAQEAAQSVRDAVQAVRDAVTRVRLHNASVKAAAGRLEALGLPLRDEYQSYDTGAQTERGKSVVRNGPDVFGSLEARETQQILKWMFAQVDRAEFHGRDTGSAHLHGLDAQIVNRITGK